MPNYRPKPREANPNAKLTSAQVRHIRRYAGTTHLPYGWRSSLARTLRVSPGTIGDIQLFHPVCAIVAIV